MAKKQMKQPVMKNINAGEVHNDSLKEAIDTFKSAQTRDNEVKMLEELQKAKFLVPVQIMGDGKNLRPAYPMVTTPDKKNYFPVFTDEAEASKLKLPEGQQSQFLLKTIKEYEPIFRETRGQAAGIIVNPVSSGIVLKRDLISKLNSMKASAIPAQTTEKKAEAPVNLPVSFSEPRIYPTALVTAVYDACGAIPEISRVWFKQMMIGPEVNHALIVEADQYTPQIETALREAAEPKAKNIPVQVIKCTPELEKQVIKDAVALYDRELNL